MFSISYILPVSIIITYSRIYLEKMEHSDDRFH
jgi:hypothetical protein